MPSACSRSIAALIRAPDGPHCVEAEECYSLPDTNGEGHERVAYPGIGGGACGRLSERRRGAPGPLRGNACSRARAVRRHVRARRRAAQRPGVEHTWPSVEKALRTKNPGLDDATLANLRGEFERIRLRRMQELLKDAPVIYARHLKVEEMREIIAFYRTPAGTRLMQVVPPVLSEMFAIALPGMPAVINDTHEEFLCLARQRGLIK